MIRRFQFDDIPEVARLRSRVFGQENSAPLEDLRGHFQQVFFETPWSDEGVSALVWEQPGGSITGFLGLVPRPMRYRGQRLQAVVTTQLMVDGERSGPVTAVRLLKEVFSAEYDLVLSDGATPRVAELWERCGGERLWLSSFEWFRSLRPAEEFAGWLADRRPSVRPLSLLFSPVLTAADSIFARVQPNRFHHKSDEFSAEPITAEALLEARRELVGSQLLQMEYDESSLEWVLGRLVEKKRHGELFGSVLRDREGSAAGCYVYLTKGSGSSAWVVQVLARPGLEEALLNHLFASAWHKGAVAVRGVMDTRFAVAVKELHGRFRVGAPWTVCRTPHPELLTALQSGEAAVDRFDMEFWMRFTHG